ncbi:MAG: hypothetical protein ACE5EQ_06290 [Phycisphaerae bacterium]
MKKTNRIVSYWLKGIVLPVFLLLPAAAAVCGTFDPPVPEGTGTTAVKDAIQDPIDTQGDIGIDAILPDFVNPVEAEPIDTQVVIEEPAVQPDVLPTPSGNPVAVREALLDILSTYHAIAASRNMTEIESITLDAEDRVLAMTDENLAVFQEAMPEMNRLRQAVGTLAANTPALLQNTNDSGRSAGFPNAAYSSICGSDRNDTTVVFAAKVALQAARLVWSAASRGCDEVVVVLGEGGNTSLVCIAADAVLFAAESVLEDFVFCDEGIDSAEIEGSYERLFHLHGDVEVLQEHIEEIWEREIEENIFHRNNLVSLFLPAAHGGRLESVRDIVSKWIMQSAAAGMDVTRAECYFQQGLQNFDNNLYKAAFKSFSKAYKSLTEDDSSDDSHDDACDDSADDSTDEAED